MTTSSLEGSSISNADILTAFRRNHAGIEADVCHNPKTCTKHHNRADPETNEVHHYGCECGWCVYVYWSMKNLIGGVSNSLVDEPLESQSPYGGAYDDGGGLEKGSQNI